MTRYHRRDFLRSSAALGGTLVGLQSLASACTGSGNRNGAAAAAGSGILADNGGYGPIAPVASANTGDTFLALPEGFQYTVFGRTGEPLSDGHVTPGSHDGMAAFDVNGELRLVRNHEVRTVIPRGVIAIGDPALSYDEVCGGGTTTLVIDPETRLPIRSFVSLSGTNTNCAGGPTPWGSWITCEEITVGPSRGGRGFRQAHGYCFDVPAASDEAVTPVPLKAMGRFVHEAVAVDEGSGIVYLTEDATTAGCYRFLPAERENLAAGGRLQMLAIDQRPRHKLNTGQTVGAELPVVWVDIADPDPASAASDSHAVYAQGLSQGAATFARLEGCFRGNGHIYLNSTSGGNAGQGQVWQYTPDGEDRGTLVLLFESPGAAVLNNPDNMCVSPRGGLVLCEDGDGDQYLRGLTQDGKIFDFARNTIPNYNTSEFCGSTFSPDGETLFVNVQEPGLTLAIWGPWDMGEL